MARSFSFIKQRSKRKQGGGQQPKPGGVCFESSGAKHPLAEGALQEIVPFLFKLLDSKGKKNILLFTYNLGVFYEKLKKSLIAYEEPPFECVEFKFNRNIYLITCNKKKEPFQVLQTSMVEESKKRDASKDALKDALKAAEQSNLLGGLLLQGGRQDGLQPNKREWKCNRKKRFKQLLIKDLEYFGYPETKLQNANANANAILPEIAESFFSVLETIKKEFKVNINTKHRLSAASVGEAIFKYNNLEQAKTIPKLTFTKDMYIRQAYFGGRNEVYSPIVLHTNFSYDVNSLYPSIMEREPLPVGVPQYRDKTYFRTGARAGFNLDTFHGFLNVTVEAPDMLLPVLPKKPDAKKRAEVIIGNAKPPLYKGVGIIYPTGRFTGVYFSEELKYALSQGYKIIEIKDGYQFKELAIVFDKFVKTIYSKRITAKNPIEALFWKKILNTIYGRYALITTHYIRYDSSNHQSNPEEMGKFDPMEFTPLPVIKAKNIAISAAITAYARIYMHKILMTNKINPLYWDTDGIFTTEPLPEHLISKEGSKELGKFRLESINSCAVFISGKHYFYKPIGSDNYVYKMSGVKKPFSVEYPDTLLSQFIEQIKNDEDPYINMLIPIINHKKEREMQPLIAFKKRRTFFDEKQQQWITTPLYIEE